MKTILRKQVQAWLKNKDFEKGIGILLAHRPRMARQYAGRPVRYASKLEYELKKLAGIDHITALAQAIKPKRPEPTVQRTAPIPNPQDSEQVDNPLDIGQAPKPETSNLEPETSTPEPFSLKAAHKNTDSIPPEVEKVVREHSRLFALRSQLADQREKLGDSNKPDIIKQRKVITQAIHTHSERIEQLFQAHTEYLRTRKIPDMNALFAEKEPPKNEAIDKKALEVERKSLLSANQRDRTWLVYNSAKKGKSPSPMPNGTRRNEIEHRMAQRTERIKQINTILGK